MRTEINYFTEDYVKTPFETFYTIIVNQTINKAQFKYKCTHVTFFTWILSFVATFEIVIFTLDKSRDSELQNGISYCIVEEQWESNFALNVDKLVNSLLR